MWIDPNDPEHFILGDDGGIASTCGPGRHVRLHQHVPDRPVLRVSYDMQKPYRVCGGLQDNGSWCGPSRARRTRRYHQRDWFNVGGGDGFYTAQDPDDPNIVYSESQGGNASRLNIAHEARTQSSCAAAVATGRASSRTR